MNKRWLQKKLPNVDEIRNHRMIRIFGSLLHDANLWHINRRCICRAVGIGVFCAFLPVPFQMLIAAALAIWLRANLPLSVALVWLSNPITMPPLMYACYKFGAWLLHLPPHPFHFEASFSWLLAQIGHAAKPLLIGSVVLGLAHGVIAYCFVRLLWRIAIIRAWRQRHKV